MPTQAFRQIPCPSPATKDFDMKRVICVVFALCALPISLDVARGEDRWYDGRDAGYGRYGGAYGAGRVGYGAAAYGAGMYGAGMYGAGMYGGGTAAGNYLQGQSQVIAAKGQYNEQTSRAMINNEEARSKYIDNEKKWTDTYFAMREENQAHEDEKLRRDKHSQETLDAAARAGAPKPLSSEALDPLTGKIHWPDALRGADYAAPRTEIDRLLQLRATTSGDGTGMRIRQSASQMTDILKSHIRDMPANDYMAARKFLDSLAQSAS